MAFILESIIEEIHAAYEALPGGRPPLSRNERGKPCMGNLDKAHHGPHFRVVWMLQGGTFNPAKVSQGENGAAYEAACRFLVWIWQEDLESCWAMMVDLLAAMRATVYGINLGAQVFLAPTETEGREMHSGEVFVLDVTLSVPVPLVGSVPTTTVILETHQSLVSADNGELVGGEYQPFATVTVVGPIDEP